MPVIYKTALVAYTPEQMFALVDDIKRYPEFVPACVKSKELSRTEDEVHATLHFSRSSIEKSFTTLNRNQFPKMIEIRLIDGPFKQLEGFWTFTEKDGLCQVSLNLEFEFSSRVLAMMFGSLFQQVATLLVDSFTQRAKVVYGDVKN